MLEHIFSLSIDLESPCFLFLFIDHERSTPGGKQIRDQNMMREELVCREKTSFEDPFEQSLQNRIPEQVSGDFKKISKDFRMGRPKTRNLSDSLFLKITNPSSFGFKQRSFFSPFVF